MVSSSSQLRKVLPKKYAYKICVRLPSALVMNAMCRAYVRPSIGGWAVMVRMSRICVMKDVCGVCILL